MKDERVIQTLRIYLEVILYLIAGGLLFAFVAGCAVSPQRAAVVNASPAHPQQPLASPPVVTPPPVVERPVIRALQPRYEDRITATAATFAFDPEHEYALVCRQWELLTIQLSPGETYQEYGAGNPVEWMVVPSTSSVNGEPVAVLLIKRGPEAPATSLTVITDRNIYRLKLLPSGKGENRGVRFVRFYDPIAQARREEEQLARAERAAQRAQEPRYPVLDQTTERHYQVSGDAVAWSPIKVSGDHAHTFIELPANSGTDKPILTILRDGHESQINYRMLPGTPTRGPILITDGAIVEAKLTGAGGQVTITEGK